MEPLFSDQLFFRSSKHQIGFPVEMGDMGDAPELNHLFAALSDMDKAAECGSVDPLDSKHFLEVDRAIRDVLRQLSPFESANSPFGGDSVGEETKQGHNLAQPVDPASAEKLQALVAKHKGPRRDMVRDEETLGILQGLFPSLNSAARVKEMLSVIDRREEMQAKGKGAKSPATQIAPVASRIQVRVSVGSLKPRTVRTPRFPPIFSRFS